MATPAKSKLTHLFVVGMALINEYRKRLLDPDKYKLLPTLLDDLDKLLDGGLPNPVDKLIIAIGGAFKMGKTALALQLTIARAAMSGEKTGIFALEELNIQTAMRVITRHIVRLRRSMFYKMEITTEDLDTAEELMKEFELTNIWLTDEVFKPQEIVAIAKANGLQLVLVDNMNLVEMPGENEAAKLDAAMKIFIQSRNTDGITYIIVYQLNENGKALGSRTVYRGADVILQISNVVDYISEQPIQGQVQVEAVRGRRGGVGSTILAFDGDASRYYNMVTISPNEDGFLDFENEEADMEDDPSGYINFSPIVADQLEMETINGNFDND